MRSKQNGPDAGNPLVSARLDVARSETSGSSVDPVRSPSHFNSVFDLQLDLHLEEGRRRLKCRVFFVEGSGGLWLRLCSFLGVDK